MDGMICKELREMIEMPGVEEVNLCDHESIEITYKTGETILWQWDGCDMYTILPNRKTGRTSFLAPWDEQPVNAYYYQYRDGLTDDDEPNGWGATEQDKYIYHHLRNKIERTWSNFPRFKRKQHEQR